MPYIPFLKIVILFKETVISKKKTKDRALQITVLTSISILRSVTHSHAPKHSNKFHFQSLLDYDKLFGFDTLCFSWTKVILERITSIVPQRQSKTLQKVLLIIKFINTIASSVESLSLASAHLFSFSLQKIPFPLKFNTMDSLLLRHRN